MMENKSRERKLPMWQMRVYRQEKLLTIQMRCMGFAQGKFRYIYIYVKHTSTHTLVLLIMFLARIGVCPLSHGIWYGMNGDRFMGFPGHRFACRQLKWWLLPVDLRWTLLLKIERAVLKDSYAHPTQRRKTLKLNVTPSVSSHCVADLTILGNLSFLVLLY